MNPVVKFKINHLAHKIETNRVVVYTGIIKQIKVPGFIFFIDHMFTRPFIVSLAIEPGKQFLQFSNNQFILKNEPLHTRDLDVRNGLECVEFIMEVNDFSIFLTNIIHAQMVSPVHVFEEMFLNPDPVLSDDGISYLDCGVEITPTCPPNQADRDMIFMILKKKAVSTQHLHYILKEFT